jgi:LTXXQ motif family protein
MHSSIRLGILLSLITATSAAAQVPGGPPQAANAVPATPGPGTGFLLAHTGELQLTDAQVVKLAAIARRAEARRQALRNSSDSVRRRFEPAAPGSDSSARAARRRMMDQMRANFDRVREQDRSDLRDAIAVLTPDQQARAWEMTARGGRGARVGRGNQMRGMRRMGGFNRSQVPRSRRDRG